MGDIYNGFTIHWITQDVSKVFEDCFQLSNLHWYGGPERYEQKWPIEKLRLIDFANVLQEHDRGAIVEPYWLNSLGAYIFVNDKVPLFINQNVPLFSSNQVCFSAKIAKPYSSRTKVIKNETTRMSCLLLQVNFLGPASLYHSSSK